MLEIDTTVSPDSFTENEDELFAKHVIDGDHELLFLDTYLKELFSGKN